MKTSSKILITAAVIIFAGILLLIIGIKSHFTKNIGSLEGSGEITEQVRTLETFHSINARSGLEIILRQDTFQQVKVVADENIIDKIVTQVEDGTLDIYPKARIHKANSKKIYVIVSSLEDIKVSAGVRFSTENTIKAGSLDFRSEAGTVSNLHVECDEIDIHCVAGSILDLSGYAGKVEMDALAGSIINAKDFNGDEIEIEAMAGANISVGVFHSIDIDGNSGAQIKYNGESEKVNIEVNSGARAHKY